MGKKEKRPYIIYNLYTFTNMCMKKREGNISKNSGCLDWWNYQRLIHFLSLYFSVFSKSSMINMHYFHKLSEKITLYIRKKI